MDPFSNTEDFYTLAEEKFDFDISLSPASSREDEEDEVFVGPVAGKEKEVYVGVENVARDSVSSGPSVGEEQMWSPLPGDDFDRMSSEAQKLATLLKEDQQPHTGQTGGTVPAEKPGNMMDDFVQDTEAKLDMFSKPFNRVPSPIKRETFCVQDSPLKELPPAIQKRLLKGSSVGSGVGVKSTRARLSTSSPASGAKTKMALRSKAGLGTSGILPSKPVVPATPSATSLKTSKTRAVPAENPSRLAPSSMTPSSKVGLRSRAPPLQTRGVVLDRRRNTSSSLSSVSSVNSNMSISPTGKGKLSTLNASISGPSSRAPTNMSRLGNASAAKTRRSALIGRAADPPAPPTAITVRGARRSISVVQSRKTSETDPTPLSRSTPLKRSVPSTPTPFQQSPAKRASVSSVSSQQLGQKSKPMAFVAPTQSTRLKGLKRSDLVQSPESLKLMKPKRLRSACSLDSLLQEPVVPNPQLFHTPSMSKIRRPSALPPPVNQRLSGIPAMTPKRLPGSGSAGTFVSARRTSNQSPARVESATSEEELVFSPKIQPFSVENADPTGLQTEMQDEALTCVDVQSPEVVQEVMETPEESQEPQQEVVEHPEENREPQQEVEENQEPWQEVEEKRKPEPSGNLIELHSVEAVLSEDDGGKTREGFETLLLDLPVSSFKPEDKPLIDLCNYCDTPDLIRTVSHKAEIQLIDLTSPLIKWSPEDKKENAVNEAPLINFSF